MFITWKKERLDAISAVMPSIWLLILYLLFMYLSSSIWWQYVINNKKADVLF